jgi:hypothetical protein
LYRPRPRSGSSVIRAEAAYAWHPFLDLLPETLPDAVVQHARTSSEMGIEGRALTLACSVMSCTEMDWNPSSIASMNACWSSWRVRLTVGRFLRGK